MKKIQFILVALILSWFSQAHTETISVVTEEYPPYNYTEHNKITGLSTEIVLEVLKRTGFDYSLKSYPWARAYNSALQLPNVLIYSIGRNEKRESLFKWVGVVAPYDVYLFKLKKRSDIEIHSLEDAKKYTIGVVRDDVRMQYLQKNGFEPNINLDVVSQDLFSLRKLMTGRIDLIPIDGLSLSHVMKHENMPIEALERVLLLKDLSVGLYLAFSIQTNDSIVKKCQDALGTMKKDGSYGAIVSKYLK